MNSCTFSIESYDCFINIIRDPYPIGSIYLSLGDTDPSVLFGGTWERIKDRFLLASGDTWSKNSTGGNKDAVVVKHNHTQNSHNHTQNAHSHKANSAGTYNFVVSESGMNLAMSTKHQISTSGNYFYMYSSERKGVGENASTANATATNNSATATNQESGVDGTGKNMPPYLTVNVWKRIS